MPAITKFLGFKTHCDEGIVMGLSAYGNYNKNIKDKKKYISYFRKILSYKNGPVINRQYFSFGLKKLDGMTKSFLNYLVPQGIIIKI